jgi:hypothetical protein
MKVDEKERRREESKVWREESKVWRDESKVWREGRTLTWKSGALEGGAKTFRIQVKEQR